MSKLSHDWRILLLVASVALSLVALAPTYTASGWKINIEKGFDIQGGARAVLSTEQGTSPEVISQLVNIMQARLNVYGLTDIKIRQTSDLSGNTYIIVEAAGLTEDDVRELLAKQGKFEARIMNQTIISGSDIEVQTYKSGISKVQSGYSYQVSLNVINLEAAQKFADVTRTLSEEFDLTGGPRYLNESLELYIDNIMVGSPLKISADLKGKVVTDPVVEGGASSREEALKEMEQMTAILQTGALPTQITILSVDSVSPRLGAAFLQNTILAALVAVVAVFLVVFLRYRNLPVTVAISLTGLAEVAIILGILSAVKNQLDLASIAGIIMIVGTGVNQQIIITDEILSSRTTTGSYSLQQRMRNAGFIIFAAFGTTAAAMVPLVFIGLGAVKGFAITSLLGLAAAIMITRPAYMTIIQHFVEEKSVKFSG